LRAYLGIFLIIIYESSFPLMLKALKEVNPDLNLNIYEK